MENFGADPLHAMAMDHAKYRDALKNHMVIKGVLDALCMQEWNVTCEVSLNNNSTVQEWNVTCEVSLSARARVERHVRAESFCPWPARPSPVLNAGA